MMDIAQAYSKELISLAAVLIAFLLNKYFRPRAKIIYGIRNSFTFLVDQPLVDADGQEIRPIQTVTTRSLSVSNTGRETAKNVEITFNWKPHFLNVWPPRHFKTSDSAHGRHSVILDSLSPGEIFGVELLSVNSNLPEITVVRSEECVGNEVIMSPQQVQPAWKISIATYLIFAGIAATFYLIVTIIQLIANR